MLKCSKYDIINCECNFFNDYNITNQIKASIIRYLLDITRQILRFSVNY